ncbi:MAG: hypothetical protein GF350_15530 [Chitinivibrionales bacterium]|nr:hypothetical protein [Chitinivibrionales bacterium]
MPGRFFKALFFLFSGMVIVLRGSCVPDKSLDRMLKSRSRPAAYAALIEKSGHVPEKTIALCTDELKRDPSNVAALLVRASAWAVLNVHAEMKDDFAAARQLKMGEAEQFFATAAHIMRDTSPEKSGEPDTLKVLAAVYGDIHDYAAENDTTKAREIIHGSVEIDRKQQGRKASSIAEKQKKDSSAAFSTRRNSIAVTGKTKTINRDSHLTARRDTHTTNVIDTIARDTAGNSSMALAGPANSRNVSSGAKKSGIAASPRTADTNSVLVNEKTPLNHVPGPPGVLEDWDNTGPDPSEKQRGPVGISALVEYIPYEEKLRIHKKIERCANSFPKIPRAIAYNMCVGNHFYEKQVWSKAMTAYLNVLDENPSHLKALCMLARCIGNSNYYDLALRYVNRAVAAGPSYGEAYFVRAWIYHCMRNREKEVFNLRKALRLGYDRRGYTTARLKLLGAQ